MNVTLLFSDMRYGNQNAFVCVCFFTVVVAVVAVDIVGCAGLPTENHFNFHDDDGSALDADLFNFGDDSLALCCCCCSIIDVSTDVESLFVAVFDDAVMVIDDDDDVVVVVDDATATAVVSVVDFLLSSVFWLASNERRTGDTRTDSMRTGDDDNESLELCLSDASLLVRPLVAHASLSNRNPFWFVCLLRIHY